MTELMLDENTPKLRPDGHLQCLNDWNIDVARALAATDKLSLKDAHFEIIDLLRNYYQTYNISPIYKLIKKDIAEKLGPEKSTDDYLISLFPYGLCSQGIRIAGIPKPLLDAEIDNPPHLQTTTTSKTFSEFTFNDKVYPVYAKGNLMNPEDWSKSLAEHMAEKENIHLSKAHWELIHFLRKFYFQYGISPMVKLITKHMSSQFGENKSNEEYLYKLFPAGPARQGSRIAGLPEPQGCIDP